MRNAHAVSMQVITEIPLSMAFLLTGKLSVSLRFATTGRLMTMASFFFAVGAVVHDPLLRRIVIHLFRREIVGFEEVHGIIRYIILNPASM